MALQQTILKDLVLKHQQTHDPIVFEKILKRVDPLIIRTVNILSKRETYLERIELQELYQIGIIGVYDAVRTSPLKEDPEKFPARVVAYIKSNIRKEFNYRNKEKLWCDSDVSDDVGAEDQEMHTHIEFLDLLDIITHRYIKGLLSKKDIELLKDRFFKQQSLQVLGQARGITREWARRKIIIYIEKIKCYLDKDKR